MTKEWSTPSLTTYGDVEEVTAEHVPGHRKDKNFDGDDGFTLQAASIGC